MNQEIDAQFKACWRFSDELDFVANYYPTEVNPFAAQHQIIKEKLRVFFDGCENSDDDLVIIIKIRTEIESITKQMRTQLTATNGAISEPAKQQNIISDFVNLQMQIEALNETYKTQFKLPLKIANSILDKIKICQNVNETLQYKLSSLTKKKSQSKIKSRAMTYFFSDSAVNRQKNLESQANENKLKLARLIHQMVAQLLNIFRIQQANNLDLHANNSVAKFRTNSQVLAFAAGSKRRPAFTSSALGFVNA